MEGFKLFDSEWKLMDLLWEREPISAKELSAVAAKSIGWNKNTTYTVIKKLVEKGVIRREEPGFICSALLGREQAQKSETNLLIDKLFKGSKSAFFAAFLQDERLSDEEIEQLRAMIEER